MRIGAWATKLQHPPVLCLSTNQEGEVCLLPAGPEQLCLLILLPVDNTSSQAACI